MTNEATKVEQFGANRDGEPISMIISSSALVAKGSIMSLVDGRTTAVSTTIREPVSGIAAMGKGYDHSIRVSVWTNIIAELVASGALTIGCEVYNASDSNHPNSVATTVGLANPASGAEIIGIALDAVADYARCAIRINK